MKAIKLKTKSQLSEDESPIKIESSYGQGWILRIISVWYGGEKANIYLRLFDSDGDMVFVPIPGQSAEPRKTVSPDIPLPVKLPISYLDEDMDTDNEIIIWGEVYRNVDD